MGKFRINGIDEISASFEQLTRLTDSDKMSIIMPAAKLLLERQVQKIQSLFNQRSGDLANSLTIEERSGDDGPYAYIFPKGKHSGSSTGKRKGKRRSNGSYSGTNAEVAYILEYGSSRISARHWMESANEESADEVAGVQADAWDRLLSEKGL